MDDHVNVMDRAESVVFGQAQPPVTGIRLWYEDDRFFFAGDESGTVLETNAETTATQTVAEQALAKVAGYVYRPFRATRALMDMEAELGDGVNVGGIYGQLVSASIIFGNAKAAEISAPDTEETDHEFVILSPQEQKMLRKLTLGKSYFGTRITRQNGLEVVKTAADGTESARVRLNSDVLAFYDADGEEALFFDAAAGKYRFRGDVEITGGTMNINNNFIVDLDGNLTINGNINLSGGTITWGGNEPAGGDGISETEARTLITGTLVSSPTIRGAEIYGGTYYGNEFNVHPDTAGDNSFNLYGISGTDEFNFLKITCRPNSDTVEIWSPGGADIYFGGDRTVFGGDYTVFEGRVDFAGAAVTGLNVSATAVWG